MEAFEDLLSYLRQQKYQFVTVTPLTHERVLKRKGGQLAKTLRDAFGWSLPFDERLLPRELMQTLERENIVTKVNAHYKSTVRVATVEDQYFLHSSFPTDQEDSVFFGPDTYRFVKFMKEKLTKNPLRSSSRVLDIGSGSGAGGWMVAKISSRVQLVLNDINPMALKLAEINVRANGPTAADKTAVEFVLGDNVSSVDGNFDLIVANPPFIADAKSRTYRDGGEKLGRSLSLKMVEQSLPRLNRGGRILLYTGVAIENGVDEFNSDLRRILSPEKFEWTYEEIDPDIFGEELEQPAYKNTERIAAVGVAITKLGLPDEFQ